MRRTLAACAVTLLLALPAQGGLPPEHRCPTIGSAPTDSPASDAVPQRLREGMVISYDTLLALRELLPREIWSSRHVFFYPGMRMEIGSCHRRFPVPPFFTQASERFADRVSLDKEGNLDGYIAGLPFPPETIDPKARDAGMRWAWNLEHRFRGAGPTGNFRLVDIPTRVGSILTYRGFFFLLQTRHRADLAQSDYTLAESKGQLWVGGGRFLEPQNARHLAWRQMRPKETHQRYTTADETYVYVPTMRKVRRAATSWVDGFYVPRYRVTGDSGGGGLAIGGGGDYGGPAGAINPTAAESIHQTEHLPRGFTALALRPNAYVWRVLAEREVLAPLNSAWPGYPINPDKNFGPHGLSVASDRWDVRWAVVIEGKARMRNQDFETLTLYVDYQTQQPLYSVTKGSRGRLLDVGIPVHRFSDDTLNYPGWPSGHKASVFDPVAEVFYRVADDSGWRRESYNVRSMPPEPRLQRRFTSTDFLVRGR
jgi:hypothetical protein